MKNWPHGLVGRWLTLTCYALGITTFDLQGCCARAPRRVRVVLARPALRVQLRVRLRLRLHRFALVWQGKVPRRRIARSLIRAVRRQVIGGKVVDSEEGWFVHLMVSVVASSGCVDSTKDERLRPAQPGTRRNSSRSSSRFTLLLPQVARLQQPLANVSSPMAPLVEWRHDQRDFDFEPSSPAWCTR